MNYHDSAERRECSPWLILMDLQLLCERERLSSMRWICCDNRVLKLHPRSFSRTLVPNALKRYYKFSFLNNINPIKNRVNIIVIVILLVTFMNEWMSGIKKFLFNFKHFWWLLSIQLYIHFIHCYCIEVSKWSRATIVTYIQLATI